MTSVLLQFVVDEWRLLALLTLVFALYFHYTSTFSYFAERGIPSMRPTILLGNLGPRILLKQSFHEFSQHVYNNFEGLPFGGFFEGRRPVLMLRDPDLIKAVLIRDFDHFVDRNSMVTNEPNYLRRSLLNLKGQEWKSVRSILTPTFSSSRLRAMLPIINHCSTQMVDLLRHQGQSDVEMKEFMGRFTLEVIGTCAFGIECAALKDEQSHFVKVAEKFAHMSTLKRMAVFFLLIFMPKAFRFANISFMNRQSTDELVRMLNVSKAERRGQGKDKRSDFLQLLLDAAENENETASGSNKKHMDEDTIDAQSLLFLIAGYETSSTLLSFAAHALATHAHVQSKLREHVRDALAGSGGQLTYEAVSSMDYLESFLLETLRMYPPLARLDRVCTKPYTLPGTSVEFTGGEVVVIPVYGIHMDPRHYPEPRLFRPERFSSEERKQRPSHLFLPFGAGPRNCIGLRFALVSVKLAMAALIMNFEFSVCDKTVNPVPFEKRGILLKAAKGLWVHVSPMKQDSA